MRQIVRSRCSMRIAALLMAAGLFTTKASTGHADEVVPMVFPVLGKVEWRDSFNPDGRKAGWRIHHGEDLMAPKMRPLVAAFDGIVYPQPTPGHNMLSIHGDNGYDCFYCHINDDTPGTHDHNGTDIYAYAPGLKSGDHVVAGQLVAWVGDSGNARGGPSHCHFELTHAGAYLNPAPSLRAARRLTSPRVDLVASQLQPEKGEIRLDGVVHSFDGGRSLVISPLAWVDDHHKIIPMTWPLHRWVTLQADTKVARRDAPEQTCEVTGLAAGDLVTVVGPDRGKDHATPARTILLAEKPAELSTRSGRDGISEGMAPEPIDHEEFGGGRSRSGKVRSNQAKRAPASSRPLTLPARSLLPVEVELVTQVNAFRKANGLPELLLNARLSDAAWQHSNDMVAIDRYGHIGSDGSSLQDRVSETGYSASLAAENIAVGYTTPENVLQAWLERSPEARRNLLNPMLREIGVGYCHLAGAMTSNRIEYAWTLVLASQ